MRPTRSSSLTPPAGWNPGRTGHALFCTRLGVCGLAWGVPILPLIKWAEKG